MAGLELVENKETKEKLDPSLEIPRRIQQHCRRRGLIIRPLADYVILSPPLIMSNKEADWLVDVMAESIQATAEEVGKT